MRRSGLWIDENEWKRIKPGLVEEKIKDLLGLASSGGVAFTRMRFGDSAPRSSRPPMDNGAVMPNGQTVFGTTFHFKHKVLKLSSKGQMAVGRTAGRHQNYAERATLARTDKAKGLSEAEMLARARDRGRCPGR